MGKQTYAQKFQISSILTFLSFVKPDNLILRDRRRKKKVKRG